MNKSPDCFVVRAEGIADAQRGRRSIPDSKLDENRLRCKVDQNFNVTLSHPQLRCGLGLIVTKLSEQNLLAQNRTLLSFTTYGTQEPTTE